MYTAQNQGDRIARVTKLRIAFACLLYALLMIAAWFAGERQTNAFAETNFLRAFFAFALLFAPLWFFAFGAAEALRNMPSRGRIAMAAFLALPYFVLSLGTPGFYWRAAVIVIALPVLLTAFISLPQLSDRMNLRDLAVLAIVVAAYFLGWTKIAWPFPLPALFPKLFLADVTLYCFLVGRKLEGSGYSSIPELSDLRVGFREWLFYLPFALAIGLATHFIRIHSALPVPLTFLEGVVLTALLVALPEEMFFRSILQNLLETRTGRTPALFAAAVVFGLSHFNHGAIFNWRYVLLASVAGVFYGRAWRAQRHLFAAVVTHTAVDVVWSFWFR